MTDEATIKKLREMVTGTWLSQSLYVAAKLGIADLVAGGPKTVAELARATGAHPDALYRFLRALASAEVFAEVLPHTFAMTPLADALRTDAPGSVRHLTIWYGEDVFRAWSDVMHSVVTGKPAFDHLFGMTMWEHFAKNPESNKNFNIGMGASRWQDQLPIADAYDFSGVRRLVDVGGGHGSMLAAILHRNPHMTGVLVDLPHVVEGAGSLLTDAGVADRCEIVTASAFDPLPRGDAYMLSSVLHALDDAQSHVALGRIREAVSPGGRVLIVERVLPPGNQPHFGKFVDLVMMLVNGGRERTEEEFSALLEGSGFRCARVVALPFFIAGIGLGIVEGIARESA